MHSDISIRPFRDEMTVSVRPCAGNAKQKAHRTFWYDGLVYKVGVYRLFFRCIESAAGLEVTLGAHADVLDVVFLIDGHLFALKDEPAVDPAAVADGLAPAGADGLHLLDGMRQLQQTGGTGEAFQRKISPQAVADHRDVQVYCDHEQLFGLLRGEELALVGEVMESRLMFCLHSYLLASRQNPISLSLPLAFFWRLLSSL